MVEWVIEQSGLFERRFKKYEKRHQEIVIAILNNLDTYVKALNRGTKPQLLQAGFIHREPQGVIALDQTGAQSKLNETRLYLYALESDHIIYLITMGDKASQQADLADCRKFVADLRRNLKDG